MTQQTAAFRAKIEELVATLPREFAGRVVVNIAANGGVKVELSEFIKVGRKAELRLTDGDSDT